MLPSSASAPVAEQPSCVPTTTPEEGEMVVLVMVGAVFSTDTSAEELAVAPLESVAVDVQVMVDPTFACEEDTI